MHSLIPLSLLLTVFDSYTYGVHLPVQIRTTNEPRRLSPRENTTIPVGNFGNAQYFSNITIGGQEVAVLLDTGSSDLWVNFPGTLPETEDLGKSLRLSYAIGSASGNIHTADVHFYDYDIDSQAFLLVTDTSSFSTDIHSQGYDGLLGLGPNEGSRILDEIDKPSANTLLTNIFTSKSSKSNYITILLDREGDPGDTFTGQMTISEIVSGFENITSMPKIDVAEVHRLLQEEQHWQGLTDKDNGVIGPDGEIIKIKSIVPKAPDGQLVAVFDSGFTFTQVPRELSDAIYGRVKGAEYNTKSEWWLVPCGQMLSVTFNFGGVAYPVHPLDTVDDNFKAKNAAGERMCIGSFQPITTAFSLLGNYDMIMGMNFLRNAYQLLDFGDWANDSDDTSDPYIQLLPLTDVKAAHDDFVQVRLGGTDTTSDPKWALLSTSEMQHSPVSEEEKKKKYQEMILSRWPYILTGCLLAVLLIIGIIVWRCCCRRGKEGVVGKGGLFSRKKKATSYLPMQDQSPIGNGSTVSLPYNQYNQPRHEASQNPFEHGNPNQYDRDAHTAHDQASTYSYQSDNHTAYNSTQDLHGHGNTGYKAY